MLLKKYPLFIILCCAISVAFSQSNKALDENITPENTKRIIGVLAADDMRGRKTFSPEIDKAATFIASEFKAIGLQPLAKADGFLQPFTMINATQTSIMAMADGQNIDSTKVLVFTTQPTISINQTSGYKIEKINTGDNLSTKMRANIAAKENRLVLVNESFAPMFNRMGRLKQSFFPSGYNTVFMLANEAPTTFSINATHVIIEKHLKNVVGILPGKSKKDEYVIFSGHYDHLGTTHAATGDTIFNGANDDAAGTTAVIQLAKYYKAMHNNERTIVFATFTAEEIGGFGSQYFSQQFDPEKVVAMFNIEMIGTDSKWGNNSAYITGYEKTNMGEILQKNLTGTGFTFYPDPYTTQNLFYRSDNATLARLGVPAHTISTSKMDAEPNYHKVSDEIGTLDLDNMNSIIKAIALSATSIVNGKDAPTRVNTADLK
jgi:Zn-dependent M28 family amino/carboxypeptidase